jgi:hypothetical protein
MSEIIYPTPTPDEESYCPTSYIRQVVKQTYNENPNKYKIGSYQVADGETIPIDNYALYCDVNKRLVEFDFMLSSERIMSNFDVIQPDMPIYKDWVHEDRPIRAYFNAEQIQIIWQTMAEMFVYTKQLDIPTEVYGNGIHQYYLTIEPEYEGFLASIGVIPEYK